MKKTLTAPVLAQLSKGAPHTLNHTTPLPPFPETSPGGTPTRSISIRSIPNEPAQAGFLNLYK